MIFSNSNCLYIAIVGDIKSSKKIENRAEIQNNLMLTLERINEKYKDDIASKFIVTLGDEFQGLLCKGYNIMNILQEIERKMYPTKIRFGIGIGRITTKINSEMSLGADGPGYYKAREAIDYLKRNEKKKQMISSDTRVEVECDNKNTMILLNSMLSLITVLKESWSDRQREIIWDMLEHQDNQIEAAKRLQVTQPTIQKSLARGNYFIYKDAVDTIEKVLSEIGGENI
jgi:hypothetical protein